jgi:glycosyltransferase involved in cell wall biosynthesis
VTTAGADVRAGAAVRDREGGVREAGRESPDYLMVVPVPLHRLGEGRFVVDSAFGEHLRLLRQKLSPTFGRLVVATPEMSRETYELARASMMEVDEAREGIEFVALFPASVGRARFLLREFVPVLRKLFRVVRASGAVHAGPSHNLYRPIEASALAMGVLLRKVTVSVNDIDLRQEAWMNYRCGRWSRRGYLVCRFVYDPIRNFQLRLAVRTCSVVLLKGAKMCEDFGRGRANVHDFLDSAYSAGQIIPDLDLQRKLETMASPDSLLEIVYFGRLTGYKGIDRCLRALQMVRRRGVDGFRFHVIGGGEDEGALKRLAGELGLEDRVIFHGPLRYGPELFGALYGYHLLLAAPLSEDTPRSALDAMAAGLPILAFDTYYYRDLARSGAVEVVQWPSVEAMAERLAALCQDRAVLADRCRRAVEFAHQNVQDVWLDRRVAWTRASMEARPGRARRGGAIPDGERAD